MSDGSVSAPDVGDTSLETAMKVAGIVMAFLCGMIVLRYLVNRFIDVAVLQDCSACCRLLGKIRRWICPWYHPRTLPEQGLEATGDQENTANLDSLIQDMNMDQKKAVISSILCVKAVSAEDVEGWKQHDKTSSETEKGENQKPAHDVENPCNGVGMICPICIHEVEVGSRVVILESCKHVMHLDCIVDWLCRNVSQNRDCPVCRREAISESSLRIACSEFQGAHDDSDPVDVPR